MAENKNKNQINIELSEEVAEGIYSNLAIITHSQSEFIIDFVKLMPGVQKSQSKITHHSHTRTRKKIVQSPGR